MLELHQTDIGQLSRCPLQWYYRRIEGIIRPPGIAAHVGSGAHRGVDVNMAHKVEHGYEQAPLDAVTDAARDKVNERWDSEGVLLDDDEKTVGETKLKGEAVDRAVAFTSYHYANVAPPILPTHTERKWKLNVPKHGIVLAGIMDTCTKHGIIDAKFRGKSPVKGEAENSVQMALYRLARKHLDGIAPKWLRLDVFANLKKGIKYTPQAIRAAQGLTDQSVLSRIAVWKQQIDAGIFPPCDPNEWVCSAKYCGYWNDVCPYGRRARGR